MSGVLVVGSLHYDILVAAPQLPRRGETVTGSSWTPKFGGKGGNQAAAAARAGATVRMLGAVGRDAFGAFLRAELRARGVADDLVRAVEAGSGVSVAISESAGDYGAVIVSGANARLDPRWVEAAEAWEGARAVLLQNEVPEHVNIAAAVQGRRRGVTVCLNAAPFRALTAELLAHVDVLLVNALEAEALIGARVVSLGAAASAAVALLALAPAAVVTAGEAGVAASARDGMRLALPGEAVRVVSTHGAGDAFAGTLGAALAQGRGLEAALRDANRAAARHVSDRAC